MPLRAPGRPIFPPRSQPRRAGVAVSSLRWLVVVVALLPVAAPVFGSRAALPVDLAPYFRAPELLTRQFDERRSPLLRPDGSRIATAAEWVQRRAEIRREWFDLLGPWPELIEAPRLEIFRTEPRDNVIQHAVRVEVAAGVFQNGYLLVPNGRGPFPAAFVPFYDPETSTGLGGRPLRDFAYQLARRGFVTLAIGSPGGDARKPELSGATCQPLAYLAYIAANCHTALARLPAVDPQRIAVVGHSYGGKWALFASCLYDKFACAVWSDPGIVFDETRPSINYWEPWYLGWEPAFTRRPGLITTERPRTGAYRAMIAGGRDLHELHALMAPRPFLVSGGSEDPVKRWLTLSHAVAVNQLLGYENRVALHNRPAHDPTPESNEVIYRFLEHFLGTAPAH
jgi:dienelactone hydrolase